jgi:hypothetical protein
MVLQIVASIVKKKRVNSSIRAAINTKIKEEKR